MVYPIDLPKLYVTQGFKPAHQGLDIRDYDKSHDKLLPHRAMEKSRVLRVDVGKRYGEPYIDLEGLETGIVYRYCHNTSMVAVDDIVEAGQPIGRASLIGTWGPEGKKAFHLHLGMLRDGKFIDPIPVIEANGLIIEYV